MMDKETFRFLEESKHKSEDVQAMFGLIKAVLGSTEEVVRYYLLKSPFESGIATYLEAHGENLRDLLCVIEHLLLEMEEQQDAIVNLLAEKTFEARKELQEYAGEVSAAL